MLKKICEKPKNSIAQLGQLTNELGPILNGIISANPPLVHDHCQLTPQATTLLMLLLELHDSIDSTKLESNIFKYMSDNHNLIIDLVEHMFSFEDRSVFIHALRNGSGQVIRALLI